MFSFTRTLLNPTKYLRIKQRQKAVFDFVVPATLTVVLFSAATALPSEVAFFGEGGVVTKINELLQVLVGFYIAGLAAVSTYQHRALDQELAGNSAAKLIRRKGDEPSVLNRRQLVSFLFSYLAFLSLTLYFVGVLAPIYEPLLALIESPWIGYWVRNLFRFGYVFLCSQMFIVTLLGMFYLGDRIHRAEPTLLGRSARKRPTEADGK